MAKEVGFPFAVTVDDSAAAPQVISNDVTNFTLATPRGVQDVTGVDKSAMERLLLLADFSCSLNGVFNATAGQAHAVFSNLANPRTTVFAVSGQTLSVEALFTDYALTRNADGSLTWTAPGVLQDGTVPTWT